MRVASIGSLVPHHDFAGQVHSVFAHACNFAHRDAVLTLACAGTGNAPTTLVLAADAPVDLRRLFTAAADRRHAAATGFLRSVESRIERRLVREARLHPYVVAHTMQMLLARCSSMHLHLRHDRRRAQREFGGLVERVALGILKRNRESYAL